MTTLTIAHERDRVILDLGGQRHDTLLTCAEAERLEHALRFHADYASKEAATLLKGEVWHARVESYDGYVALRFLPPAVGAPRRVPLTAAMARALAEMIKWKRQQAQYKMRFETAS